MTIREILNAYKGYLDKETRMFQSEWERTRWLGTIQANTYSKKQLQPNDLIKFPWEGETQDVDTGIKKLKEMRKWREQDQH